MKLTIEIPDKMIDELDVAIQKFNARAQAEIDIGRSASLLEEKVEEWLTRQVINSLRNFILSEHRLDLEVQTETLVTEEADKISKALNP